MRGVKGCEKGFCENIGDGRKMRENAALLLKAGDWFRQHIGKAEAQNASFASAVTSSTVLRQGTDPRGQRPGESLAQGRGTHGGRGSIRSVNKLDKRKSMGPGGMLP